MHNKKDRVHPRGSDNYNPQENPKMYPLELTKNAHICLWAEDGKFKYTIAYWIDGEEEADLKFCGDRPLEGRVDWNDFRELIVQGGKMVNKTPHCKKLSLEQLSSRIDKLEDDLKSLTK